MLHFTAYKTCNNKFNGSEQTECTEKYKTAGVMSAKRERCLCSKSGASASVFWEARKDLLKETMHPRIEQGGWA